MQALDFYPSCYWVSSLIEKPVPGTIIRQNSSKAATAVSACRGCRFKSENWREYDTWLGHQTIRYPPPHTHKHMPPPPTHTQRLDPWDAGNDNTILTKTYKTILFHLSIFWLNRKIDLPRATIFATICETTFFQRRYVLMLQRYLLAPGSAFRKLRRCSIIISCWNIHSSVHMLFQQMHTLEDIAPCDKLAC